MAGKEITLTNIGMYNEIVSSAYAHYQELKETHQEIVSSKLCDNDLDGEAYTLQASMDNAAAVIIVFSEMTFEAFCNAYLSKHFSKNSFQGQYFIQKVDFSIVTMLNEIGISVADKDVSNYYGGDIARIVEIRKKLVHRYPVKFSLDLDSDSQFETDSVVAANQIKDQFLRRIEEADVENAATAYQKFKDKLSAAGVDFSKMGFIC